MESNAEKGLKSYFGSNSQDLFYIVFLCELCVLSASTLKKSAGHNRQDLYSLAIFGKQTMFNG